MFAIEALIVVMSESLGRTSVRQNAKQPLCEIFMLSSASVSDMRPQPKAMSRGMSAARVSIR